MSRPQFSLKTLLWLMAVVAAICWAAMLYPPESYPVPLLIIGAAAGWITGASRGRSHALLGSLIGIFLAGPMMIAFYFTALLMVGAATGRID